MIESGFIGLRRKKLEEDVTPSPFIRAKDLIQLIEDVISRDSAGFRDEQFGGKWWLLFSGDKGGGEATHEVPR